MISPNGGDNHFCWQKIGITGDRSCEALSRYVHCRNCPEYSSRGRTLFDREMPGDYRRELSEELAQVVSAVVEDAVSVLVFRAASEWFALPSAVFQEVAPYQKAYFVPFRSGELLAGLVNVNGELLLCVSLEAALGIPIDEKAAPDGKPRLCVVRAGRERFAFGVDEALGVRRISAGRLQPVPATLAKSPSAQVASCFELDGRNVGLIDEKRIFNSLDRSLRW
jgi:chemotaxis-related protein WspD